MKQAYLLILFVLVISVIPSVSGIDMMHANDATDEGLVNRTLIRGVVLFPRETNGGKSLTFFAVRVHYRTVTLEGVLSGVVRCRPLTIENSVTGYIGRCYVFGTFRGRVDIFP